MKKRKRAPLPTPPTPQPSPVVPTTALHYALLGGLQEYLNQTYGHHAYGARELLAGADLATVHTPTDFLALVTTGLDRAGLDPLS